MVNLRIVLAIVALTLAILWGTADTTTPADYSKECQSWADMLQAGEDDVLMHKIGCDDGAEANGLYARSEGTCNAIARQMFRTYRNLQLIELQVKHVDSTCVNLDDGSWITLPPS